MNPAPNPLIEAAVAPLSGNAEHQLSVTSILAETADPDHPGAAEAIARWKSVDGKRQPFLWKPALYVLGVLSVILMVSKEAPDLKLAWAYKGIADFDFPESTPPKGITAAQMLILGDPLRSDYEQKESRHLSDPENPAYYAEYAYEHWRENGDLPADYFETVSRIAPRNSYFLYMAASMIERGTIEEKDSSATRPEPRVVDGVVMPPDPFEAKFEIKGEAAYQKALSLLEKAGSLPDYEDYEYLMFKTRLGALPRGGTSAERMSKSIWFFEGMSGIIRLYGVGIVLSARAEQLSNEDDTKGFLRLNDIRMHLTRSLLSSPSASLMTEIILVGNLVMLSESFHFAAKRLGLEKVSDELLRENRMLRDDAYRMRARMDSKDNAWMFERGSFLTASSLPEVINIAESPPPLGIEDLAPLRYADHALAMRAGLSAVAVVLLTSSALVFLFRFAFPPALRKTALRLVHLMRTCDWAIVIGLGVVPPIASILALRHFTQIGGRSWSLEHFHFLFPGVHIVAILLLALLAPAIVISWRLGRRVAPLGVPFRPGLFSMSALLGIVALAVGAYPLVMKFGMGEPLLRALAAAPAFWLAVVMGNGVRALVGNAKHRLSLVATSIALLPAYASAMILISIFLPAFRASEKRWLAQDTIFNLDADPPSVGLYETRLAAQKRKETREILGLEN